MQLPKYRSKVKNVWVKSEKGGYQPGHKEKGYYQGVFDGFELGDERNYCLLCGKDLRKMRKRGNDVYNYRVKQRFDEIEQLGEYYGDERLFDINEPNPQTNCLFVTFTYDTKLTDRESAWDKISIDYNRAISRLRRKFGKISVLRVWESSKKGYPHVHAIMLFQEKKFDVFEYWNRGATKSTFRIQQKKEFDKVWHSNIDVIAVSSVKGILKYISKYLRKVHSGESKYDTTLANMWIHRKQSFAISGNFTDQLRSVRLDSRNLHNSNKNHVQSTLDGKKLFPTNTFIGIFSLDEIKRNNVIRNPEAWFYNLQNLPKKILKKGFFPAEKSSLDRTFRGEKTENVPLLSGQIMPSSICKIQ